MGTLCVTHLMGPEPLASASLTLVHPNLSVACHPLIAVFLWNPTMYLTQGPLCVTALKIAPLRRRPNIILEMVALIVLVC